MRRVDLDDMAHALFVDGDHLVADDLRQRERQEVPCEIRRAHTALAHAQQTEAWTEAQDFDAVARHAPAGGLVAVVAILRRRERLVGSVVEGVEGNGGHVAAEDIGLADRAG